jgi:hypothetical protein
MEVPRVGAYIPPLATIPASFRNFLVLFCPATGRWQKSHHMPPFTFSPILLPSRPQAGS